MEIWKKMWVGVFFWTQCILQQYLPDRQTVSAANSTTRLLWDFWTEWQRFYYEKFIQILLLIFTAFLWHLLQLRFPLHFMRWANLSFRTMQAVVKAAFVSLEKRNYLLTYLLTYLLYNVNPVGYQYSRPIWAQNIDAITSPSWELPPRTPFDHIWAMVWSGARGNIARTAL